MAWSNFEVTTDERYLYVKIDLRKEGNPTNSGKNIMISSSGGVRNIPSWPGFKINWNVWRVPGMYK